MDDYKKYSLEQLDNWIHDAISCSEASPQEIYDVIRKAVEEEYYCYKHRTGQAYELLALLNGNGKGHLSCDKDDPSPECKGAWNSFWEEHYYPEEYAIREAEYYNKGDKVTKWVLPIEVDELSGECYFNLPDDLLEAANLNEGDTLKWIDNGDGSFSFKKSNNTSWVEGNELAKTKNYDEMIAEGWSMTDDGFWIKEN
jgi:antitoxin component of MazEF toxin-antitoxin module